MKSCFVRVKKVSYIFVAFCVVSAVREFHFRLVINEITNK
jgi:hypothetical protein